MGTAGPFHSPHRSPYHVPHRRKLSFEQEAVIRREAGNRTLRNPDRWLPDRREQTRMRHRLHELRKHLTRVAQHSRVIVGDAGDVGDHILDA